MQQELGGRIGAVLLKGFHITPTGIFVYSGILVELFPFGFIDQTAGGNELYVNLDSLSGIGHLFIRFGNVLRIWKLLSSDSLFLKETIKSRDRALIAPLHELDPEYDQTGMRVAPAHILNELDFLRGMLVWVVVRAPGAVSEGIPRTVIAVLPTIDILAVGFEFDGRLGNTKLLRIANQ